MSRAELTVLIDFLGFFTGTALYGSLLLLAVRARREARAAPPNVDHLPLVAAILGLAWNLSALAMLGGPGREPETPIFVLRAVGFTALGFLPAVVLHSALREQQPWRRASLSLTIAGYGLGLIAAALHALAAATADDTWTIAALRLVTAGFATILLLLPRAARRGRRRLAVTTAALAIFGITALHWSNHDRGESLLVTFFGHHASMLLAFAILYEDFRFAFADLFLKRALAFLALVALSTLLYLGSTVWFPGSAASAHGADPWGVGVQLALWIGTALAYPELRRACASLVDRRVLRRPDYHDLCRTVGRTIGKRESPGEVLEEVCAALRPALSARTVCWEETDERRGAAEALPRGTAEFLVEIPCAEVPKYQLVIGPLVGGRRLLSDDHALLDAVALMAARRIDALRVAHERCEHAVREEHSRTLAAEAELRALQAQLNPHFLFNALTTIGHLIAEAPSKALETLQHLSDLLRGVLTHSASPMATLGEEVAIAEAALGIERARFEDRLRVSVNVPAELRHVALPSLIVQPLVENAVKHAIAANRRGGTVSIAARLGADRHGRTALHVTVSDTGAGAHRSDRAEPAGARRGLALVERRLQCHYGDDASLSLRPLPGGGTRAEMVIPMTGRHSVDTITTQVAS